MTTTIGVRGSGGPQGPARATSANVSQREDLANFISMITRDETPFTSSIGKTKATAIYHEWRTDTLDTPGASRVAEGQDYIEPASSAITASPAVGAKFGLSGPNRTRLGNYTQINAKTIGVSGTRRAIDQAGVADEYAYQLKKRGTELRRDVEFDMVHSWNVSAAVGAQGNTARSAGSYQAFINDASTTKVLGGWGNATTQGEGTGRIKSGSSASSAPVSG